MRCPLMVIFGLTTFAGLLHAQEQEGRLVDRLLRPDLSLTNSQQNKEFVAAESTSVDKKFETNRHPRSKNDRP